METMLMLIVTLILFYLVLVLPIQVTNRRRRRQQASLRPGDRVVGSGGIIGRVKALEGTEVVVELARGVEVRMLRSSLARMAPSGRDAEPEAFPERGGTDKERAG